MFATVIVTIKHNAPVDNCPWERATDGPRESPPGAGRFRCRGQHSQGCSPGSSWSHPHPAHATLAGPLSHSVTPSEPQHLLTSSRDRNTPPSTSPLHLGPPFLKPNALRKGSNSQPSQQPSPTLLESLLTSLLPWEQDRESVSLAALCICSKALRAGGKL